MERKEEMKSLARRRVSRGTAFVMAVVLVLSCLPAAAADQIGDGVTPTCDEAYYATLDYYGNLTDGSVVKSYVLNGAASVTDYGSYDQIVNLTDGTQPSTADGKTVFRFNQKDEPDHFYFDGKTAKPFETLPWTVSMTYQLNGVATKAEDLAGKTGLVKIGLNLVPNDNASEYAKNNYVLVASTAFNQDDILSLKAEGAQVQLIGNLRLVMLTALPGEEEHFTIEVGSKDFSFDGMTFLMVPATLAQLDQIAELGKRKDELKEDYDKLNSSLDTLLDSVSNMSGSLYATADGLDELDGARGTISAGKGQIYSDTDVSLGDLNGLVTALEPVQQHLETASKALTDINTAVSNLSDQAVSLKSNLSNTRNVLEDLQDDLDDLRSGEGSISELQSDMTSLGNSLGSLNTVLSTMQKNLGDMKDQVNSLSGTNEVTVNGMTVSQIEAAVTSANSAHDQYEAYLAGNNLTEDQRSFADFLVAAAGKTTEEAAQIAGLWETAQTAAYAAQIEQAESVNQLLNATGMTVNQMKELVKNLNDSTAPLLSSLSSVCTSLGQNGLSGTLKETLETVDAATGHVMDLNNELSNAILKTERALELIDTLNQTVNSYIPEAQQALKDGQTLTASVTANITSLSTFLTDFKALAQKSGTQLDSGTKKTLEGLAATLRKAAKSTSKTGDVKSAKGNISSIIEDTWNEHTGDVDNLLNMDSTAAAVSMTSVSNPAPTSIQVLMRTQEIKVAEKEDAVQSETETDNGTFWSRVSRMFKDLWHTVTGIFH